MSNQTDLDVTVTHRFAASPEQVYDAFLDPEKARQFLFATPEGTMVRYETDPKVGGKFVMTDRRKDGDVEHVGEYKVLDRPRRIVFEFGIPADNSDKSQVEVEIASSNGGSEATVTHSLNPNWKDFGEESKRAWTMMLGRLEKAL